MTKARRQVILRRYLSYIDAWQDLADEGGWVHTTFAPLAERIEVARQSVGPALRRMEELGLIRYLNTHTADGTSFQLSRNVTDPSHLVTPRHEVSRGEGT